MTQITAKWRHRVRLLRPSTVRAALWTWRTIRTVRRELPVSGVRTRAGVPPQLPDSAAEGVRLVLRRVPPTCLERSLTLQAWLSAHETPVSVIIGIPRSGEPTITGDNPAHAWLENEDSPALREQYAEIHRIAPLANPCQD